MLAFYFRLSITRYTEFLIYFLFMFSILLIANILCVNQFFLIHKQKDELNAYTNYLPYVENLITSVRMTQHNYSNELQAIRGLLYTQKDYCSLKESLSEQLDVCAAVKEPDYLLKLNMYLVSGFLYQKDLQASKDNKKIIFHLSTYYLESVLPEYLLVKMMGILIDNALEATKENSQVDVYINSMDGHVEFQTRNEGYILSSKDINNFFSVGYSKGKSNHSGLGLPYVKKVIVDQYNGTVGVWNENTDIVVSFTI